MTKHFVLPDVQAKPDMDFSYLGRIGKYLTEKQPEKIICIGDFADMESLSSYDVGKKSFEGRRYVKDIEAARTAMETFLGPINQYNAVQKKNGKKQYKPELILTLGNHENRINRAVNDDPKLDGVLSLDDLGYADFGWTVHPFLDVVVVDGVAYSHYFVTGVAGRPATTARQQLLKKHMSCVAGHQQGLQIFTDHRADGVMLTSIIAGSCYEHNENYMGPQGNKHWRGALMLHDVQDGSFDVMPISMKYFNERKYK
jgi:hypothetical protein